MKYYYNKITLEYCGTSEPLGYNFAYTEKKPPKAESDESVLFKDGKWVVEKVVIEESTIPIEEQIAKLKQERKECTVEMTACILRDEEEEAKRYARRMKEIDEEIKELEQSGGI